jgi:hypothetical protein
MARSFAILAFIACAFGAAIYFLQRPTIASGDVLADELVESNPQHVKTMHCDKAVPVSASGAHFACEVLFKNGEAGRMVFEMDRAGSMRPVRHEKIKRSTDPWGD